MVAVAVAVAAVVVSIFVLVVEEEVLIMVMVVVMVAAVGMLSVGTSVTHLLALLHEVSEVAGLCRRGRRHAARRRRRARPVSPAGERHGDVRGAWRPYPLAPLTATPIPDDDLAPAGRVARRSATCKRQDFLPRNWNAY